MITKFLEKTGKDATFGPGRGPQYPQFARKGVDPSVFYKRFMTEIKTCTKESRPPSQFILMAVEKKEIHAARESLQTEAFFKTMLGKGIGMGLGCLVFLGVYDFLEAKTGIGTYLATMLGTKHPEGMSIAIDFVASLLIPMAISMKGLAEGIKLRMDDNRVKKFFAAQKVEYPETQCKLPKENAPGSS